MSSHDQRFEPPGCSQSVGAYLLGAMEADEARAFEAHLETCADCSQDVAALRPVVSALPVAVPQLDAPADLKRRLMSVVESEAELLAASGAGADRVTEREPRRRLRRIFPRPAVAAAVAATALACGVGAGVILTGGDDTGAGGVRTFAARVTEPGGRATLAIGHEGATLRVADMPSPPGDRVYQVWTKRDRAAPVPTDAMFTVDRNGSGTVAVPGKLDGVDQVLVTAEPRGGSLVPTRAPVVIADV